MSREESRRREGRRGEEKGEKKRGEEKKIGEVRRGDEERESERGQERSEGSGAIQCFTQLNSANQHERFACLYMYHLCVYCLSCMKERALATSRTRLSALFSGKGQGAEPASLSLVPLLVIQQNDTSHDIRSHLG